MVYFWSTKTHVDGTPLGFGTSASAGFYAHDKLIDIIPIKSSKYVNHFLVMMKLEVKTDAKKVIQSTIF